MITLTAALLSLVTHGTLLPSDYQISSSLASATREKACVTPYIVRSVTPLTMSKKHISRLGSIIAKNRVHSITSIGTQQERNRALDNLSIIAENGLTCANRDLITDTLFNSIIEILDDKNSLNDNYVIFKINALSKALVHYSRNLRSDNPFHREPLHEIQPLPLINVD